MKKHMKSIILAVALFGAITAVGCAVKNAPTVAPRTVAPGTVIAEQQQALSVFGSVEEAAKQLQGAATAVNQLAGSPEARLLMDPTTAQAITNYLAWAALGLKAIGAVAQIVGAP